MENLSTNIFFWYENLDEVFQMMNIIFKNHKSNHFRLVAIGDFFPTFIVRFLNFYLREIGFNKIDFREN